MTKDQPEDAYRFGFTKEDIVAEIMAHKGMIRDGCYVPTRPEVATWPADRLWMTLLGWVVGISLQPDSERRAGGGERRSPPRSP